PRANVNRPADLDRLQRPLIIGSGYWKASIRPPRPLRNRRYKPLRSLRPLRFIWYRQPRTKKRAPGFLPARAYDLAVTRHMSHVTARAGTRKLSRGLFFSAVLTFGLELCVLL